MLFNAPIVRFLTTEKGLEISDENYITGIYGQSFFLYITPGHKKLIYVRAGLDSKKLIESDIFNKGLRYEKAAVFIPCLSPTDTSNGFGGRG